MELRNLHLKQISHLIPVGDHSFRNSDLQDKIQTSYSTQGALDFNSLQTLKNNVPFLLTYACLIACIVTYLPHLLDEFLFIQLKYYFLCGNIL